MNTLQTRYEEARSKLGSAYLFGFLALRDADCGEGVGLMEAVELLQKLRKTCGGTASEIQTHTRELIETAVHEVTIFGKVSPSRAASRLLEMAHDAGFWELALMYQPKFR